MDVGDIHVVSGWTDILVLFLVEDIDADHVNFGVAVLASLRGRHLDNFAGASLNLTTLITLSKSFR